MKSNSFWRSHVTPKRQRMKHKKPAIEQYKIHRIVSGKISVVRNDMIVHYSNLDKQRHEKVTRFDTVT